jgi:hypothetical protein
MATKIITTHFSNGGVPSVGLTPTIDIMLLTPTTSTPVVTGGVLADLGGGWYRYNFTMYDPSQTFIFSIDGGASLQACERYRYGGNESYSEDITDGVWNADIVDYQGTGTLGSAVSQTKADTATILINQLTATSLVETLLKYQTNRTRIDPLAKTLTIYDDDCTTVLQVFDLKDSNGNASVIEVCERRPQTC